jgi:hypothetical protein
LRLDAFWDSFIEGVNIVLFFFFKIILHYFKFKDGREKTLIIINIFEILEMSAEQTKKPEDATSKPHKSKTYRPKGGRK